MKCKARALVPLSALFALLALSLAASAQEQSVNPGINKTFQDPNVGQFVERFESEGREVYDKRLEIVDACQVRPHMTIADIGAGTGLFTRIFAGRVGPQGHVYAVDIAQNFVDHVEEACRKGGLDNVEGVLCTATSCELPPASVDLVFVCDTYHHFEFPQKTMASIHRALRPGGHFVLLDFHRIEGKTSAWIMNHVRAGQETFSSEVIAAGFQAVGENKDLLKSNYFLRFQKTEAPAGAQAKEKSDVDSTASPR